MPTRSFDIDMVLDTDEAMLNFLKAIEIADKRGPYKTRDFSKEIAEGRAAIAKGCPFDK